MIEAIYPALYRFVLWLGWLASPFSEKLRRGLDARRELFARLGAFEWEAIRPIWFHVASAGELEQAIPILDALHARGEPIFLSYFSPSAERAVARELDRRAGKKPIPWLMADYLPHDLKSHTRRAVRVLRPKAFVAIHREIWPRLLRTLAEENVPRFLFAAHFPDAIGMYRRWLPLFDAIGTTSEVSAEQVRRAAPNLVLSACGDPRIDRVLSRRLPPSDEPPRNIVLASVWPKDWKALLPSVKVLARDYPIVVVPHEPHPDFLAKIRADIAAEGLSDAGIVLVDKVGFLAEMYRQAAVVFIGGSFTRRVHNTLEPAAYGCTLYTGPLIQNSLEAQELRDYGYLQIVEPGTDFAARVRSLTPERREAVRRGVSEYLARRGGTVPRYLALLDGFAVSRLTL